MRSSVPAAAAVVLAASLVLIGAGSGAVQAFYSPGCAARVQQRRGCRGQGQFAVVEKDENTYSYDFAVCTPKDGVDHAAENLGEVLVGDRTESTPYKVGWQRTKNAPCCAR